MELAQFKQHQRRAWEGGDYRPVGRLLEPAARVLVERSGVEAGQRVLDVATGSGSVAIAAAQAGADAVGVDFTDAWFAEARRRAEEAGVDVALQVGDAEDLPVADGSFDVVLSSFGAIFAPRHEVVASELARACRPGGTVALTAWTSGGSNDRVFSVIAEHMPPLPAFATPSIEWGDPEHCRAMLSPHKVAIAVEHHSFAVEFPTPEAFESFTFENSGPLTAARRALEARHRWQEVHTAMREAIAATNEADDGSYRTTWDFLLVIGTKAA